jgi:hypothetical protein
MLVRRSFTGVAFAAYIIRDPPLCGAVYVCVPRDGAFIAAQTDPNLTLERLLEPLAAALVAAHEAIAH